LRRDARRAGLLPGYRSPTDVAAGDAEGENASFLIAVNVFSVTGTWIRSGDPSTSTEGRLVVTC
jgi:hypothetical protein